MQATCCYFLLLLCCGKSLDWFQPKAKHFSLLFPIFRDGQLNEVWENCSEWVLVWKILYDIQLALSGNITAIAESVGSNCQENEVVTVCFSLKPFITYVSFTSSFYVFLLNLFVTVHSTYCQGHSTLSSQHV